jgi:DNA polymerase eta
MQHVATWREGDEKWAYHEDAASHIATDKVSLDPYRLESRKIFATIKDALPAPPVQRVEKASIDEVFLDLSAQVHGILMERYPELQGPPPYDDPTENLPLPPTTALDWKSDALVDLDLSQTEDDDPDWDDIVMLIGSEICRDVRAAIREKLKYTCSAGIARNKMIAKLGSGYKKPNQQTVVRDRAVQYFLSNLKFTKIRNLGGKLGDQVVSTFGTDEVSELLKVPMEQLKFKIGDDTGNWLYNIIRGNEHSEVHSRTQIKSMLSAKSFRPSINTFDQGVKWLRIFVADIYARLVEEGVCSNKRRPKTINLHHRTGSQTRSRQGPIPSGRAIDEMMLFDLAKNLLSQVILEGTAFPCSNLSLSVGGFEDGITGNRGIGSFLVRGEEAKAMKSTPRDADLHESIQEEGRPEKRRKFVAPSGIERFLAKKESTEEHDADFGSEIPISKDAGSISEAHEDVFAEDGQGLENTSETSANGDLEEHHPSKGNATTNPSDGQHTHGLHQQSITSYFCDTCGTSVPLTEQEEHQDWHFAKNVEAEERSNSRNESPAIPNHGRKGQDIQRPNGRGPGRTKKQIGAAAKAGGGKPEKGQSRLAFG